MAHPLYVAFVWHMHQPVYQEPMTGEFILPWTRLHGTKDYLHMAEVLAEYPDVHATFNFTPSLLEQLTAYAGGHAKDRWLDLSLRESWTTEEKTFMLEHFFSIHHDIIRQYPRYAQLLRRRQTTKQDTRAFSKQDYRDLAAWFNLAWIDPNWLERHPALHQLVHKGRNFTLDDVRTIADVTREMMGEILPLYRELQQRGQIEITVSPYYHPVLPLLVDTNSALEARPRMRLPQPAFQYPEDARRQTKDAVDFYHDHFDVPLRGMWPSEGGVSQAMLCAIPNEVHWIASDEDRLARSVGARIHRNEVSHVMNPQFLYQPYAVRVDGRDEPLSIIFRDHALSDRIGFVYHQGFTGQEAAEDLVRRLRWIWEHLGDVERPHLVPIILDGENCWEHYASNGDVFLRNLYRLLSQKDYLRPVTVSEYLEEHPPRLRIERLSAGSWIGGDFGTWIGEPAQNRAWKALAKTRQHLVDWASSADAGLHAEDLKQTWRALHVAESSDWFWWYSSRNQSDQEVLFDELFRAYLAAVYRRTGTPVPPALEQTMLKREEPALTSRVADPLAETADARAWHRTGAITPAAAPGAMQRASANLKRLAYAYTNSDLLLRIELSANLDGHAVHVALNRNGCWWEVAIPPGEPSAQLYRSRNGTRDLVRELPATTAGRTLEVVVPLSALGLEGVPGTRLRASLRHNGDELDSLPADDQYHHIAED
ncbi:MAG: hypothetical protein MAG451_03099 [Anaerolineales bacterium]|nr:hypothetical protein [Anaerolineales bacterium]